MKLNYDKKSSDPTYFIQQGFRNGKKTTTKNIVRIGKHSELLKITDDPLAYAKQHSCFLDKCHNPLGHIPIKTRHASTGKEIRTPEFHLEGSVLTI